MTRLPAPPSCRQNPPPGMGFPSWHGGWTRVGRLVAAWILVAGAEAASLAGQEAPAGPWSGSVAAEFSFQLAQSRIFTLSFSNHLAYRRSSFEMQVGTDLGLYHCSQLETTTAQDGSLVRRRDSEAVETYEFLPSLRWHSSSTMYEVADADWHRDPTQGIAHLVQFTAGAGLETGTKGVGAMRRGEARVGYRRDTETDGEQDEDPVVALLLGETRSFARGGETALTFEVLADPFDPKDFRTEFRGQVSAPILGHLSLRANILLTLRNQETWILFRPASDLDKQYAVARFVSRFSTGLSYSY